MGDDPGRFVFPSRRRDEGEEEPEERLVLLCSVAAAEAAGFCARLEEEGIVCGAQVSAAAAPGDGLVEGPPNADIFVREEDLEVAREVLARPTEAPEEESVAEREARYAANWICPRCGKRLDLLPVSRGVHHFRMGCAAMVALPVIVGILDGVMPAWRGLGPFPDWLIWCWVAVGFCLAWGAVLPERGKWCKACGWQWTPKE
jgi:hypothetical protein